MCTKFMYYQVLLLSTRSGIITVLTPSLSFSVWRCWLDDKKDIWPIKDQCHSSPEVLYHNELTKDSPRKWQILKLRRRGSINNALIIVMLSELTGRWHRSSLHCLVRYCCDDWKISWTWSTTQLDLYKHACKQCLLNLCISSSENARVTRESNISRY